MDRKPYRASRSVGNMMRWIADEAFTKKKAIGITDDLVFGFVLFENNHNFHWFPYHLLSVSVENAPGQLRLICGQFSAELRGKNLLPILVAIQQHRLAWIREGDPTIEKPTDTYIEGLVIHELF